MKALKTCSSYLAFIITLWAPSAYADWTPEVQVSEPGRYLYPSIEAEGDTLHVVADLDGGDGLIRYYQSLNSGDDWSTAFVLPDPALTDASYLPTLSAIGYDIYVSWLNIYFFGNRDLNIGFRASTDAGSSWLSAGLVLEQDRWSIVTQTHGVADDFLYVIYAEYLDSELHFMIAKSFDNGQTWSEPESVCPIDQITGSGVETVACGDTVHIAWSGGIDSTESGQVYYFRSTDGGESWSESFMLRETEARGAGQISIAANENGDLAACWKDYRYAPMGVTGDIFCRLSFDGGDSWEDEIQLTYVHESMDPDVAWVGDDIYIVYEDWRFDPREVWFRRSSDNGQTWGDEERLTNDHIEDRDPSVAGSADGRIYVVYSKIMDNPDSSEYAGVYFKRYDETVGTTDRIEDVPLSIDLLSAYPNPFNVSTLITYTGFERRNIDIYNIAGQIIRTLHKSTKEGKIIWDARDALGNKISSGIYFARARNNKNSVTIKMLYIK